MKKSIKITLIVLGVLIGIIILDTLQARIFDNSPFIKITENYNGGSVLKKNKGIFVYTYVFKNGEKVTVYRWEKYSPPIDGSVDLEPNDNTNSKNENKSEENIEMENIKNINVTIDNQKYRATIEDNETVKEFLKLLPKEFTMKELNGNEKYVYIDYSLPTNAINPKHITAGDIMLYGNNCLVIFYKSFDTSYSYTKIGHIDNLSMLGDSTIDIKFEK